MTIRPIFLFSLPRSGSTLLQRLIATHPAVATTNEPWFLLPLFLAFRPGHVFTSYQHQHVVRAFEDFLSHVPNGLEAYHEAIRRFALTLYTQACRPEHTHFLDKTPRYHLIAQDLMQTFPEARGILLWRNPLAVAASCITAGSHDRWNLYRYRLDLFHGVSNLLDLQRRYRERLVCLRYEDLVADPNSAVHTIFRALDLSPISAPTSRYKDVVLKGRMGDKKGERCFSGVSTIPQHQWAQTLATLPRRVWAGRYLRWLGPERVAEMGYDFDTLRAQLTTPSLRWRPMLRDVLGMCYGWYAVRYEPQLFRKKRALARHGLRVDVLSE